MTNPLQRRLEQLGVMLDEHTPPSDTDAALSRGAARVARHHLGPRAAQVAIAALVAAVVAAAAAVMLARGDDDPRVVAGSDRGRGESATEPPSTTDRAGGLPITTEGATAPLAAPVLPSWGIAIEQRGRTYLLDPQGRVVANIEFGLGNHNDAEDPALVRMEDGATVRFRRSYLVKAERLQQANRLEEAGFTPSVPADIPELVGDWRYVWPSPGGTVWLAQWSGECEIPTAFFMAPDGSELRAVTGETGTAWLGGPASVAVGWSPEGRAIVWLRPGVCGTASPAPGVYLIDPATGNADLVAEDNGLAGSSIISVAPWQREDNTDWSPTGGPRDESGQLPVDDFNAFIDRVRPPWALSAEQAALAYHGLLNTPPDNDGQQRTVDASVDQVTITTTGLPDDSVQATRTTLRFRERHDLPLELVEARWSQQCQPGRGHQDFRPAPCI